MGILATSGSQTECSFGSAPSVLVVLPEDQVFCKKEPVADILDNISMLHIMPFGLCSSSANPAVVAAAMVPQPCIPVIPGPWIPGVPGTLIKGVPAVDDTCKLMCAYAGVIEIIAPAQEETLVHMTFGTWAMGCGVISQLDTPAPGPADVVAGVLLLGGAAYFAGKSLVDMISQSKAKNGNGEAKKKTKQSGKEKADDVPSWAKGEQPRDGENGNDFAKRLLDEKYGEGNYPKGPKSEYNQLRKWGDRGFNK